MLPNGQTVFAKTRYQTPPKADKMAIKSPYTVISFSVADDSDDESLEHRTAPEKAMIAQISSIAMT
jgi:hypothetical protein